MKEQDFWNRIKKYSDFEYIKRIENRIEAGWPDVHFNSSGVCGWIELKSAKTMPKTFPFKPAQPEWHMEYTRIGARSFILLRLWGEGKIVGWNGNQARLLRLLGGRNVAPNFEMIDDPAVYPEIKNWVCGL